VIPLNIDFETWDYSYKSRKRWKGVKADLVALPDTP